MVPVEDAQVLLVPQLQFLEMACEIDLVGLNVAVRVLQLGLLHVVAGVQRVQQQVLLVGFGQRRVLRPKHGLDGTVHHFQDGRVGQHVCVPPLKHLLVDQARVEQRGCFGDSLRGGLVLFGRGRLHQQLFGDVQNVVGQRCSVRRCKGWFYGFVGWW